MSVVDAGDEGAEPVPASGLRQGDQRRPALQARACRIGEDRVEVVEGPAGLEDVDIVSRLPDGQHVGPGRVLGGGLERETHAQTYALPLPVRSEKRQGRVGGGEAPPRSS
jgi:hypothetical protein